MGLVPLVLWMGLPLAGRNYSSKNRQQPRHQGRNAPRKNKQPYPAKGKPALNPNGSSPMCNRVYRARPDEIVVAEAHLPSPMEVEHRPREAQLAGDSIIATRSTLCHGGPGGNEVPRRQWRMKRYAVPMRHRAGTAPVSPRQCRIMDGYGACSIQPPPDLFATFSVEKVGLNKLRCPAKGATTIERKTDNSRAPKAATVPSRTDSHSPAKGKPAHNPNGSSPMCNRVSKPNQTAAL